MAIRCLQLNAEGIVLWLSPTVLLWNNLSQNPLGKVLFLFRLCWEARGIAEQRGQCNGPPATTKGCPTEADVASHQQGAPIRGARPWDNVVLRGWGKVSRAFESNRGILSNLNVWQQTFCFINYVCCSEKINPCLEMVGGVWSRWTCRSKLEA